MSVPSLKSLVSDNQRAEFFGCYGGYLWYSISHEVAGVTFPVPLDDTKGGHFGKSVKAITMMRWLRKYLQVREQVGGELAEFQFCNGGYLYYLIGDFEFPVPVDEVRDGAFHGSMPLDAVYPWVLKHLENLEQARA